MFARRRYLWVAAAITVAWGIAGPGQSGERLSCPRFESALDGALPEGWSVWRPDWKHAACRVRGTARGLLVDSAGDPYAVGGVTQRVGDIRPERAYRVSAVCELDAIESPFRSVIVRVNWLQGKRRLHPAGRLVRGPVLDGNTAHFSDVLIAPDGAEAAEISLEVKWPGQGSVLWRRASVQATSDPGPRKVKVGTVYLRPRQSTPQKNLALWCEQIDSAGRLGLDIVCLGELINHVGTTASLAELAQPIPGPATARIAEAAARNDIWVAATFSEQVADVVYNTAVLFDRRGRIAGKYRKTHLPREEWKKGVRPGGQYPVFDTDFGRVAIQICYDWFFPEPTAIFALRGAEIVLAPTWGNTLPDADGMINGETVFRVRARDNGVYMVPSVYSGNSLVIDPMGRILASSSGESGVFWAQVDLNERECLQWVGQWRAIGPRDRMPETYDSLADESLNAEGRGR